MILPSSGLGFTRVGRLRCAHHWCAGRVCRIRFRHLFSGTPQSRRIRRTFFLLLGDGWFTQIDFLFDAHDLLATYLHGLDPHNFVANEAYKIHVLRGDAVDPFFILHFVGALAYFLWRTSLAIDHHVMVHSHHHVVILDGG